jgi:ATP synthase protein I
MASKAPDPAEQTTQAAGGDDPLRGLDRDLEAFEAARRGKAAAGGLGGAANEGYRVLGQLLGGVLGGVGLGWFADHLAHTSPWGLVAGLVIGTGLSIFATVQTAARLDAGTKTNQASVKPAPDDDDDDDA